MEYVLIQIGSNQDTQAIALWHALQRAKNNLEDLEQPTLKLKEEFLSDHTDECLWSALNGHYLNRAGDKHYSPNDIDYTRNTVSVKMKAKSIMAMLIQIEQLKKRIERISISYNQLVKNTIYSEGVHV